MKIFKIYNFLKKIFYSSKRRAVFPHFRLLKFYYSKKAIEVRNAVDLIRGAWKSTWKSPADEL